MEVLGCRLILRYYAATELVGTMDHFPLRMGRIQELEHCQFNYMGMKIKDRDICQNWRLGNGFLVIVSQNLQLVPMPTLAKLRLF